MDSIERRTFSYLVAAESLATMVAVAPLGAAQDKYPSRPVKIINPLPTGSAPDVSIRIIAELNWQPQPVWWHAALAFG